MAEIKKSEERKPQTLDEMQMHRQSAPRPTAEDEAQKMLAAQGGGGIPSPAANGVQNGFSALAARIGVEQIREANNTLQKYKQGKANLEQRIIDNEQWYKLRHWECMRDKKQQVQPTSAWLFNSLANKHADAMDNFPSPNILPREEGDKGEAEMLSSIIPVILEQNEFEETYDNVQDYRLKSGTGVYGVFWNSEKMNGLGDISVVKADLINLFWEPGITDIQRSRHLFHVDLADNDLLEQEYPQLRGKLSSSSIDLSKYVYDDTVDTSTKSAVVDWYYKKRQNGRNVLHYCKYVNDAVLYATENDPELMERGLYDHGQYPFVFDPLFSMEGTPCGFGYIDVGKDTQAYIDRANQAIMQNMLANAKPRHFIRSDGSVNEAEYADTTKDFIHVDGSLGQDSILPVQGKPLNNVYIEVLHDKIDELKETTGNRDISTGGTTSGVTAASAIAAMQEAGSKLSRDNNKASYRAFRKVVLMVIELIRQFYDLPRCFRIMGENGTARFVEYSNANIQPQMQGMEMGVDMGYRLPLFDVEITAQKQSPYSKMSQNELALQFFGAGFFNPQMSDQALACLEMMDFDRKQGIMQRIAQNGMMYKAAMMMMQQQQMAPGVAGGDEDASKQVEKTEALGGDGGGEAANTKKARQRVADSTSPT